MTVEFGPFSNFRVENPQANSADSVDCVDCHIAQPLRQFAVKNGLATTGADYASARLVPAAGGGRERGPERCKPRPIPSARCIRP